MHGDSIRILVRLVLFPMQSDEDVAQDVGICQGYERNSLAHALSARGEERNVRVNLGTGRLLVDLESVLARE